MNCNKKRNYSDIENCDCDECPKKKIKLFHNNTNSRKYNSIAIYIFMAVYSALTLF